MEGGWRGVSKRGLAILNQQVTRYMDGALLRTKSNYTNPQSRRLFRGEGATPKRIAALDIQAKRGADGTNIFR